MKKQKMICDCGNPRFFIYKDGTALELTCMNCGSFLNVVINNDTNSPTRVDSNE